MNEDIRLGVFSERKDLLRKLEGDTSTVAPLGASVLWDRPFFPITSFYNASLFTKSFEYCHDLAHWDLSCAASTSALWRAR